MKKILIILLLILSLSSCGDGCEFKEFPSKHLIDVYKEWSSVELDVAFNDINCKFLTDEIYCSEEVKYHVYKNMSDENVAKFHELAKKNGDGGYYWSVVYEPYREFRTALANGIVGIEITSDADYDEEHPAGTLLNDILHIAFTPYRDYLNNYDHATFRVGDILESIKVLISEIPEDELPIIANRFWICFEHRPIPNKTHNFKITFTDERGNKHTNVIRNTSERIIKGIEE